MSAYEKKKEEAREEAIQWQAEFTEHDYSMLELAQWDEHFNALARKYGLTKEFRENGII